MNRMILSMDENIRQVRFGVIWTIAVVIIASAGFASGADVNVGGFIGLVIGGLGITVWGMIKDGIDWK